MKALTQRLALGLVLALILCVPVWAQTAPPDPAVDIALAVNAGWIAQQTLTIAGKTDTKFTNTILSGIEFFRASWYLGISGGVAAIVDEEQDTPRIAPYLALHMGKKEVQGFVGAAYDPQNGGKNDVVLTFGFSTALF